MKIPAPPVIPPPPPPIFVNAGEKKVKDDLGREIRDLLTRMIKITYVPGWQDMLYTYRTIINPGGVVNVTRLPFPASSPNLLPDAAAGSLPAPACLYTRLSWIILSYWEMCVNSSESAAHIRRYMRDLGELIDHTDEQGNQYHLQQVLSRCDVVGDDRTGYWLEWRGTL